jgi:drug/metabolite transporter (DMT)-like permease
MTGSALSLVLVAAVTHAVWNLAAKRVSAGGARFVHLYYTVSALACAPLAAVPLLSGVYEPEPRWLLVAAVTAALHVGYGIVLQRGYAVGDMSVVYPLARGTGPLLAVFAAVVLLDERPGWFGLAGAVLVVAGVLLIGSGSAPSGDTRARRAGILYGLLTGAVIAGYTVWDAHAVTGLAVPPLVYFSAAAVLQSLFLTPVALRDPAATTALWRAHRREVLVVGLLSPVAYLLVLFAMRLAPVSLVAPARELSIVLGGFAAWRILGEAHAFRRLAGSLVVLGGITMIALA